ncbi:MAG: ATP-binding cassette domain-containing protein [Crocinitomicaceae bacterium]|nr:ATP-binding cassette domain-containing protein [Crocinitomicaceae bacterium]
MLEITNLTKSYAQALALYQVSMNLVEGEIFGLLGPNGAGKSTLIRIVNQIIEPNSGHIKFNNDLFRREHLKSIGYLPEERGLYRGMTVQEHGIFLGKLRGMNTKEARNALEYWLDRFEISDWRKKRIEELSKGMAQKIQFIFTVLHEPKLIILDEPFSGFDPINVELIKKEIQSLKAQNRTILLSTHNMNSVEEICDRAMLLHQGKSILEGQVKELREKNKDGMFTVRFEGIMFGFVNALWTGFEIVDTREFGNNRYEVDLKMMGDNTIDELMGVMIGQVKIEAIFEKLPGMQEVFISSIAAARNPVEQ